MQSKNLQKDLVTVVTVTYNAENLLEETILSVLNQKYENIEYIIIDGGSTDGTVDIIKKYEDKIDYWVSEPDDGIYFAMNKAIKHATGEWINFMNAGDTFADNGTVEYVMKHKKEDAELIYGNFSGKKSGITFHAKEKKNWYRFMPFCHQTLFTHTSIMKVVPFDTNYKLASDHNFIIKMYEENKNFDYINKNIAVFNEDGYAQNNLFLSYIESLKVLLESNASKKDLEGSWWYKGLKMDLSFEYRMREENNEIKIQQLHASVQKLSRIKFFYNPIKKYKAYKQLLAFDKNFKG